MSDLLNGQCKHGKVLSAFCGACNPVQDIKEFLVDRADAEKLCVALEKWAFPAVVTWESQNNVGHANSDHISKALAAFREKYPRQGGE